MNYYRTDRLEPPHGMSEQSWQEELDFYNISSPTPKLSEGEQDNVEDLYHGFRKKMWLFFENPESSIWAKAYSFVSLSVVLLASANFVVDSLPELRVTSDSSDYWNNVVSIVEAFCIIFSSVEVAVRFALSMQKSLFFKDSLNIIDVASVLPWYIDLVLLRSNFSGLVVLRVVRLIKIFRIFRIGRYSEGLRILIYTIRQSKSELGVLFLMLAIAVVLYGSILHLSEFSDCLGKDPPEYCEDRKNFESIPKSMWWAVVTLTTVGYGDVIPQTGTGKFFASLCVVTGVLMLSGPISVLSNTFGYRYEEMRKSRKKKQTLEIERRNMLLLEAARGKLAFGKLIKNMLQEEVNYEAYEKLVRGVFEKIDRDNSRILEKHELKEALQLLGLNLSDEGVEMFLTEYDADGDGYLNPTEFLLFATSVALDSDDTLNEDMQAMLQTVMERHGKDLGLIEQSNQTVQKAKKNQVIPTD
eukprot:765519-Hanusia_phi.AAC.2